MSNFSVFTPFVLIMCKGAGRLLMAACLLAACDTTGGDPDPPAPLNGRIVFSSLDPVDGDVLWAVNTDGSDLTRLTFPTDSILFPYQPRWSPDGQHIVYVASAAFDASHLMIMNADGTNKRDITSRHGFVDYPEVSPDGERVFYGAGGFGAIFFYRVIDIDGTNERCVTCEDRPMFVFEGDTMRVSPRAWGSTSDRLYGIGYALIPEAGDTPEVGHLFEVSISTSELVQRLTQKPIIRRPRGFFRLSPDGRRVLYHQSGPIYKTLYVLSSLEASAEALVSGTGVKWAQGFRWGSDSRHIVYVQTDSGEYLGNKKLYVMDIDGDRTPIKIETPFADHNDPDLYVISN